MVRVSPAGGFSEPREPSDLGRPVRVMAFGATKVRGTWDQASGAVVFVGDLTWFCTDT